MNSSDANELARFALHHQRPHFPRLPPDEQRVEDFLRETQQTIALFCLNLEVRADKLLGKQLREFIFA